MNGPPPESRACWRRPKKRLTDLGWTEGQNVAIDYKFAGVNPEHVRAGATELVVSSPDVIFAASNVSVAPLQKATSVLPIVFTQASDPVGSGFVSEVNR
jgi:putative ABC transport system substrate-binding protein